MSNEANVASWDWKATSDEIAQALNDVLEASGIYTHHFIELRDDNDSIELLLIEGKAS